MWRCRCGAEFPADQNLGYQRALDHTRDQHPGESRVIQGVVDTDTGEWLVHGFGPRALAQAKRLGILPEPLERDPSHRRKSEGRGGGETASAKAAGVGVRARQLVRSVWLDLPLLETLFQRSRSVFGDGWPDSDEGFSRWLHDTVIGCFRPHAGLLFGLSGRPATPSAGAGTDAPPAALRRELAEVVADPEAVADSELLDLWARVQEAAVWSALVGPHQQRWEKHG